MGRKWSNLGHAGVLVIDNKTGQTKYYEYGRYDAANIGEVRDMSKHVSNVTIGKNGMPTQASLNKALSQISGVSGQGGKIEGAYFKSENFVEMINYANDRINDNSNPDREPYSIWNNNCGTFATDVIQFDEGIEIPLLVDPIPNSQVQELQGAEGATSILYEP